MVAIKVAATSMLINNGRVKFATGTNNIGSLLNPRITFAMAEERYMCTPLSVAANVRNRQVQKTNETLVKVVSMTGV